MKAKTTILGLTYYPEEKDYIIIYNPETKERYTISYEYTNRLYSFSYESRPGSFLTEGYGVEIEDSEYVCISVDEDNGVYELLNMETAEKTRTKWGFPFENGTNDIYFKYPSSERFCSKEDFINNNEEKELIRLNNDLIIAENIYKQKRKEFMQQCLYKGV